MKYRKRYFTDTAKPAPPHSDMHQISGMLRQFLYEKFPVLKQCRCRRNIFKLNVYWHPRLLSAMKYRRRYFAYTAKPAPPHSDMHQIFEMLRQFLYEKFPVLKQCRRRRTFQTWLLLSFRPACIPQPFQLPHAAARLEPLFLLKKYYLYNNCHRRYHDDRRISVFKIKLRHLPEVHTIPACYQCKRHEYRRHDRK